MVTFLGNAKNSLQCGEYGVITITADTLSSNESEILVRFLETADWDQPFTSTQNVFAISSARARYRNLHDVGPSIVKCQQNADAFANINRNFILSGALEGPANNLFVYRWNRGALGVLEWVLVSKRI